MEAIDAIVAILRNIVSHCLSPAAAADVLPDIDKLAADHGTPVAPAPLSDDEVAQLAELEARKAATSAPVAVAE